MKTKQPQLLKFAAFIKKNVDYPFWGKKKVMECALLSSVTYSCEAWICGSIKAAQTTYMSMVKTLAGVRVSTTNNLVLTELGLPSIETRVKTAQKRFLENMLVSKENISEDPFMHIWQVCKNSNTKGFQYLSKVLKEDLSVSKELEDRKVNIKAASGSKSVYYCEVNPHLELHAMYEAREIKEHVRIIATRLRLSSHDLAIEKGRWSRTKRENRLCSCGLIQTEEHVVCSCIETESVRLSYQNVDFSNLFKVFSHPDPSIAARIVRECYELSQ